MSSETQAAPTSVLQLASDEKPSSDPKSRPNDIEEGSEGLASLRGMLATFQQKEASKCEEKGRYFGFDFNSGRPKAQGNSRFVWDVTIS